MKQINYERLLIAFMLITSIAMASYFIIWAFNSEGYKLGLLYYILSFTYSITAFANKIFDLFGVLQGWGGVFLGVCFSGLINSILIEIILIKHGNANSRLKSKN